MFVRSRVGRERDDGRDRERKETARNSWDIVGITVEENEIPRNSCRRGGELWQKLHCARDARRAGSRRQNHFGVSVCYCASKTERVGNEIRQGLKERNETMERQHKLHSCTKYFCLSIQGRNLRLDTVARMVKACQLVDCSASYAEGHWIVNFVATQQKFT